MPWVEEWVFFLNDGTSARLTFKDNLLESVSLSRVTSLTIYVDTAVDKAEVSRVTNKVIDGLLDVLEELVREATSDVWVHTYSVEASTDVWVHIQE